VDGLFAETLVLQDFQVFVQRVSSREITNEPHALWQMFNEVVQNVGVQVDRLGPLTLLQF